MNWEEVQRILRGRDVSTIAKELEYAEWVATLAEWDTFFTGTFRNREEYQNGFYVDVGYSEQSATRAFRRFVARHIPGVPCFFGIDRNPSRDGHHVHGLLQLRDKVRRDSLWREWFEQYGVNRIEPIESLGGVSGYCAKYPLTGAQWWDVVNFRAVEKTKPEADIFVNCTERLAARRAEADRLIARWGPTSRPKRPKPLYI